MEFVTGFIVGVVIAGIIGRAKFLKVQTALRNTRNNLFTKLDQLYAELRVERNLTEGLTQELAERTR